jgi:hypothetical protein
MPWFENCEEPLLHKAVLEDNHDLLNSLSKDKELLLQTNKLGFTALELAQLLNRRYCVEVLQPNATKTIKVVFRGNEILSRCNADQFEKAFKLGYLSHLRFASYAHLKRTIHNCPWILKSNILGKENRELGKTYHKQLSQGFVADVTIKWIDPQIGYGVFCNHELPAGTYVGEYTGTVRQLYRLKPDQNIYCFHYPTCFWSWNYFMVDALREGNEMRFINHSVQPNLEPKCLVDRGLLHLVFITSQDIERGGQLTFNYGSDYWKHRV